MLESEKEYIETKRIKDGESTLEYPFNQLQDWFNLNYGVAPINFIYEILPHNNKPRLNLVWEKDSDKDVFLTNWRDYGEKEKEIIYEFQRITKLDTKYSTDKLFVINDNFSGRVLSIANQKIEELEIEKLKKKFIDRGLWKIMKNFSGVILFLNTQKDKEVWESQKIKEEFSESYSEILGKYEHYGYTNEIKTHVILDSKERIDNEYNGDFNRFMRNM
ncbi:hypothetical protein H3Z83_06450 [Tenacibaculum sp. S7007]|uniref:Uncharacterized protein n=1 Tax=Tenacibaculum pelagium TaxID=2759527 RepID=A0A839AP63_9FLAO|nr:hypothetical protein [Tenacibaculum pelagium]MBA6156158.1 hypothetical protein [Tenacibaculum pelagium]